MNKQISLSNLEDELSQVRVPWNEWTAMIKPCYYKGERGNKPYDLGLMLRLYLIQNLYNLADEATVAEVTDSRAFSDFCGVESSNQIPDGDTLGRFRNLLVKNELQEKLFAQVVEQLTARGLILKKGTIVDSTIIAAPTSTKNKERKRDSDAHQTRKGNMWYFGYKAHIGVDKGSGLTHTVKATPANVHDVTMMTELLTGAVYYTKERAKSIKHSSVAMSEIQGRRDLVMVPNGRSLHEYANLYFDPRNPMMFKRRNEDICVEN